VADGTARARPADDRGRHGHGERGAALTAPPPAPLELLLLLAGAGLLLLAGVRLERELLKRQLQVLDGAAAGDVDLTGTDDGRRC
jgi:hypothetical protein